MITVSRSLPKLDITTRAAKLNIRHKRPQFRIRHRRPKMEIRKKAPVFKIVRSASAAKAKGEPIPVVQISRRFTRTHTSRNPNFTDRIVSYSKDYSSETVNVINQETIGSALDMIAAENEKSAKPSEKISIEWERGYFEIDWTKDIMEIEWDIDSSPEIYVEPHDIEIKIKNSIITKARAKASHVLPGTKVDRKI